MWDCRLRSDGLSHGSRAVHGSSLSSNSRGSRSWVGSERYTNHHHSVSDGALPYSDSPPDTVQEPRWTSPVRKFNLGEPVASTAGGILKITIERFSDVSQLRIGSRSQPTWFPCSTERRFAVRASDTSPGFGSPSSLSESSHWESTSKRPLAFSNRNISTRRSHMSKTVYPLVFRNPVSDCETLGDADNSSLGRVTPHEDRISPSHWPDSSSSVEYKFHKTLTELQKLEMSPDPSASSRREGFRWSSASSYDVGIDGERFDIAEHMDMESLRSPSGPVVEQKCGVCGKLLWQKSPWSSHRIMRGGDMPTAGVLPCSHVFHAECLEQVTPKTQIHDPPCPLCLKTVGSIEESPPVSEPLQMALRSLRRSRGMVISEARGSHSNAEASHHIKDRLRRNWPQAVSRRNNNGSSITSRLRRHFMFKGKSGKELFSTKVFLRIGSSSSQKPA
ncbi:hypothetical protein DKX38_029173 [Salix brachista]|uniref:RING-type domain-containing protein n=1 Tax=Salix brachista TaxID=2182728 RepID=A0A5N5J3D1_9ROSI|nr:hypothetical protein DKX38_029173 [Salix brachista]